MIDLRYLGLSLIGVFLALAVGLMTGSALGGPDKRDAAYEGLRREFELLRTQNQQVQDDNDALRRRLEAEQQAVGELLPLAVRNRLSGSTVAVVVCGGIDERRFWGDLKTALDLAGARTGTVVRVPDGLRPLDPETRVRLRRTWMTEPGPDRSQPHEAVAWLVRAVARGHATEALGVLARAVGMELRSVDDLPARRLLILTGAPDEARAAAVAAGDVPEVRAIEAAREEGVRVVAAEPGALWAGLRTSAVEPLRRRGIATVDNVDTAAGQISAVLALAGAEGHFGSTPGASRPIPPVGGR